MKKYRIRNTATGYFYVAEGSHSGAFKKCSHLFATVKECEEYVEELQRMRAFNLKQVKNEFVE